MNKCFLAFTMMGAVGLWPCAGALADDHHHHHDNYTPGYHIDHHDHVIRDSYGHIIGQYHHDVVHSDSNYILPHYGDQHDGTYYQHDGGYYYHPHSSSVDAQNYQPVAVEFGSFSHIDDLASRLESLSNEFCLDLHYNYSHNYGYQETYAEAYEILQIARYIHEAEHQQDRQAIAERMHGLDALFHHVQDDVRQWSRHHHRQIGNLGIVSKMDLMESTIHHLMNDVGIDAHHGAGEEAPPPGIGNEQAPPPPGGGGPGVFNSPPPGLPPQSGCNRFLVVTPQ